MTACPSRCRLGVACCKTDAGGFRDSYVAEIDLLDAV